MLFSNRSAVVTASLLAALLVSPPSGFAQECGTEASGHLALLGAEAERLISERGATRVDLIAIDLESPENLIQVHVGGTDNVVLASALKPFTIAAALQLHVTVSDTVAGQDGVWTVDDVDIRDFHTRGDMTLSDVIVYSSNVGAAQFAEQAGITEVGEIVCGFGLCEAHATEDWQGAQGLLLSTGIGFQTLPVAAARAYAELFSTDASVDGQDQPVNAENRTEVVEMMVRAVREGTGSPALVDGLWVAGKTGTSALESGRGVWFAGAFGESSAEVVLLVYAEVAEGWAGEVAGGSFARIAQGWSEAE